MSVCAQMKCAPDSDTYMLLHRNLNGKLLLKLKLL